MKTHRCEIWWARLDQLGPAHHGLLTPLEQERGSKLHRPADRDRSALGAALLRLAVSAETGVPPQHVLVHRECPTCGGAHGRPSIPDTGLHVSVTHSGQWAGVAVTTAGPVGLDVEEISSRLEIDPMLRMVLSPDEPPVGRDGFFVYWTRKEAVLKMTGDGLREAMTKLTVSAPGEPPRLINAAGRPDLAELTQLHDLAPGVGYAAAAAVLSPHPLLISQRFLTAG